MLAALSDATDGSHEKSSSFSQYPSSTSKPPNALGLYIDVTIVAGTSASAVGSTAIGEEGSKGRFMDVVGFFEVELLCNVPILVSWSASISIDLEWYCGSIEEMLTTLSSGNEIGERADPGRVAVERVESWWY